MGAQLSRRSKRVPVFPKFTLGSTSHLRKFIIRNGPGRMGGKVLVNRLKLPSSVREITHIGRLGFCHAAEPKEKKTKHAWAIHNDTVRYIGLNSIETLKTHRGNIR